MIPVKLTLKGIYSYQAEQTIDFEALLESGLFGIFGSVGSGKSTILEAITFALYRKTERLNKNDGVYNMMNLKSGRMKVDLECLNYRNERWRFLVEGKRNGRHFEKVQLEPTRISRYENGAWQPAENTDAQEVIGLSYDNFRRTIIIPQGRFQEFLELGSSKRTEMLEEIFNLQRFDFSREAGVLRRRADGEYEGIKGELRQYEDIDPDAITRQKKEAEVLAEALEQKRLLRDAAEEKARRATELYAKLKRRAALEKEQRGLRTQQAEMNQKEAALNRYEKAREEFSELLSTSRRLEDEAAKQAGRLEQAEGHEAAIRKKTEQLEEEKQQHEEARSRQAEMSEKLGDYELLRKLLETSRSLSRARAGLKEAEEKQGRATRRLSETQEERQQLREQQKQLRKQQPDYQQLSELESWFSGYQDIQRQIDTLQKDAAREQQELDEHRAALTEKALRWKELPGLSIPASAEHDAALAIGELADAEKRLSRRRDELQEVLSEQKGVQKLEEAAESLTEGKPCPLCGAAHHPAPLKPGSAQEDIDRTESELKQLKKVLGEVGTLAQDCRLLDSNIQRSSDALKRNAQAMSEKKDEESHHRQAFIWEAFSPERPEQVGEEKQRAEEIRAALSELEKKLEDADDRITKSEDEKGDTQKELDKLKESVAKLSATEAGYRQQLKRLNPSDYAGWEADAINREEAGLRKELTELEAAGQRLEEQKKKLSEALVEAKTTAGHEREALKETQQEAAENQQRIQAALTASVFDELDEVKRLLDHPLDGGNIRKEIKEFSERWTELSAELKNLEKDLAGLEITEEEATAAHAEAGKLKEACEELLTRTAAAQDEVKRLQQALQEKQEKEKVKREIEERIEHLKTMENLFRGRGFVNYVSGVHLRQLCETANARFHRLTNQQLKLELDPDNNFRVRDYLNGGQVRSVKTLSGGQTFQASLCLALALSESVQQDSKIQQSFFFLDEGFGSLDQETLRVVFETLKLLRKEQRVVGVISHVEALQQEMDVHLHIRNESETGSIIYRSW